MWAFGTSRSGLGLTEEKLWSLTPREFDALRQVWLEDIDRQSYMAAGIQATLYNAHFDTKGVPFTAEDVLGRGDREQRKFRQMTDRIKSMQMSRSIDSGDDSELPDWASRANAYKVN